MLDKFKNVKKSVLDGNVGVKKDHTVGKIGFIVALM
jgi:hypothetical protein